MALTGKWKGNIRAIGETEDSESGYTSLRIRNLPETTTMQALIGLLEAGGFCAGELTMDMIFPDPRLLQAFVSLHKRVAQPARDYLDGKVWQGKRLEVALPGDETW